MGFTSWFTLSFPKLLTFLDGTVSGCSQEEEGAGPHSQHDACEETLVQGLGSWGRQQVLGKMVCQGEKQKRTRHALRGRLDPS